MPGSLVVRATNRATGEVRTYNSAHPFAFLGRSKHASVSLDDPSVSQVHAYLQLVDGVAYCIDLGSRTGVLWDDGTQGRGWVHDGQTIRIGLFDVQCTASAPPEGAQPDRGAGGFETKPTPVLDVYSPTTPSGRFSLDLPVTLFGRHPNCNLRFVDEGIAYFQCALVNTRGGLWCVDLLSQRGTVLNGRATRLALLRDGDLLEAGRVSLVVHLGPDAPHILSRSEPGATMARDPRSGVETAAAVFEPLRGMMEQFQQSFMTMARMFTTMQQEHTAMMCEQMRQIQEMLREVRDTRPAPAAPALPPPPAQPSAPASPPVTPKPAPKPISPEDGRVLTEAHTWFLDRLAQKAPTDKPKTE